MEPGMVSSISVPELSLLRTASLPPQVWRFPEFRPNRTVRDAPFSKNLLIDAPSVVQDPQPKLPLFIPDFQFDPPGPVHVGMHCAPPLSLIEIKSFESLRIPEFFLKQRFGFRGAVATRKEPADAALSNVNAIHSIDIELAIPPRPPVQSRSSSQQGLVSSRYFWSRDKSPAGWTGHSQLR